MTSAHYRLDRQDRETRIRAIGEGRTLREFYIDKGHPNGAEIHSISSTGIVTIYNARTLKLCTRLIARPGQITRYYQTINQAAPEWLLELAREHQLQGMNR